MMRLFIVLFCCAFLSLNAANVLGQGDFQVWTTENHTINFSKLCRFEVNFQERFGDDARQLYFWYYEGLLRLDITPAFATGVGFREAYLKKDPSQNKFLTIDIPFVDLYFYTTLNGYMYYSRTRMQYNIYRGGNEFIYRSRSGIYLKPLNDNLTFRIVNESFWSTRNKFYEDRLIIGPELIYKQYGRLATSYMLRALKGKHQKVKFQNVLDLSYRLIF